MKVSWKLIAVAGAAVIVLVWLLTPLSALVFAHFINGDQSNVGATGDIFGVASALFNGLAFLGIIVVLVYEMEERRKDLAAAQRQFRPFIVPQLDAAGVRLRRAEWDNADLVCEMHVDLGMTNMTDDVALNVKVSTALYEDAIGTTPLATSQSSLDLPIVSTADGVARATFAFRDASARAVLQALSNRVQLVLGIEVTYHALSGVGWASQVRHLIRLDADGPDRAAKVLSKNTEFYMSLASAGRPVTFQVAVEPDSWQQKER